MSRRTVAMLGAVALLASIASIPALAGAKPAKTHAVDLTVLFDAVTSTSAVGTPGDKDRDAGIVSGKIDGKSVSGAAVENVTWGAGLTFTSTGTVFDTRGTSSFRASGKVTVVGTKEVISGTLTSTGGTGAYKGIKGTLTITGNAPFGSDTDAAMARTFGTVKY